MSIASTKGVLVDLARGPIVVTILVLRFEGVETPRKMNSAGGYVRHQFNERGSAGPGSNRLSPVRAAAPGEKKSDNTSYDCAIQSSHWATDRVSQRASIRIGRLPLPATPTMLLIA